MRRIVRVASAVSESLTCDCVHSDSAYGPSDQVKTLLNPQDSTSASACLFDFIVPPKACN